MSISSSSQNESMKLPIYGQLLAHKKVVPSSRTGYVAVDQFLFYELMGTLLKDIDVDEEWYLTAYPDVREAIDSGVVKRAAHHYVRFGYFEHRMPRKIQVDSTWYLEVHPDVLDAINNKVYGSAQAHYDAAGFREGRLPYPGFSLAVHQEVSSEA